MELLRLLTTDATVVSSPEYKEGCTTPKTFLGIFVCHPIVPIHTFATQSPDNFGKGVSFLMTRTEAAD